MEGQDQKLQEMERQLDEMKQKLDQLERRKKRRPWKIILIVAGVILGVVAAAVIAAVALMSSDKESPALAQQFIQAVVDQDVQSAYELLYPFSSWSFWSSFLSVKPRYIVKVFIKSKRAMFSYL